MQIHAGVHRNQRSVLEAQLRGRTLKGSSPTKASDPRINGFIAFTSLLIISAVALAIAASISLLGVDEAKSSLSFKKGQESLKLAEGCLEEALIRLRDDNDYTGGSLNLGDGSCTIGVSGEGNDRTITIQSTISDPPDYIKNLSATVKLTGNSIKLVTWQET